MGTEAAVCATTFPGNLISFVTAADGIITYSDQINLGFFAYCTEIIC